MATPAAALRRRCACSLPGPPAGRTPAIGPAPPTTQRSLPPTCCGSGACPAGPPPSSWPGPTGSARLGSGGGFRGGGWRTR
eukprot:180767-Alexandrium_andersonii.AAC.1